IGRMVLESCANVGEAVTMLKEIRHRHSNSYIVLDESEETFVVEATPRDVEVRKSNVCTNNIEQMKHESRYHLEDSHQRRESKQSQQSQATDAYQAFRMLDDTDRGVFSSQYKNWSGTIHTAAYFPKQKKVWFALGGDRDPLIFDFAKWMKGENVTTKRILGEVD